MSADLGLSSRHVMIRWTVLMLTLDATIAAQTPDSTTPQTDAGSRPAEASSRPHKSQCFLDDVASLIQEASADTGELANDSLALFGICPTSQSVVGPVLLELTNQRLQLLHPSEVSLAEDEQRGALVLTFHLSRPPLLKRRPVLLLVLEGPAPSGGPERVTFSSPSLHPPAQTVCLSEQTRIVLLLGSEVTGPHEWSISVQTQDAKNKVKKLFSGGSSPGDLTVTPLVLLSGGPGSETSTSQALAFLCTLRRFLGDSKPRDHPTAPALTLDSLQTLPPRPLGLSSSESLLAQLINSSAPTVFSFSSSEFPVQRAELNLPPVLLEELRGRLEQTVGETLSQLKETEESHSSIRRLSRLVELTAFPKMDPVSGGRQFCALLLLMALRTVSQDMDRALRVTRADPSSRGSAVICGLKSLTVSLDRHIVGPNSANINNCKGSCFFPMANAKNHAVLLYAHIEGGAAQERGPCCVPVAYEGLEVVDLNKDGTYLSVKPDMVATECGCR